MNVRHERHGDSRCQGAEDFGRRRIWHRETQDIAAQGPKAIDPGEYDIVHGDELLFPHRLDGDGKAASHDDVPDLHGACTLHEGMIPSASLVGEGERRASAQFRRDMQILRLQPRSSGIRIKKRGLLACRMPDGRPPPPCAFLRCMGEARNNKEAK
jgi:hypothetical protein